MWKFIKLSVSDWHLTKIPTRTSKNRLKKKNNETQQPSEMSRGLTEFLDKCDFANEINESLLHHAIHKNERRPNFRGQRTPSVGRRLHIVNIHVLIVFIDAFVQRFWKRLANKSAQNRRTRDRYRNRWEIGERPWPHSKGSRVYVKICIFRTINSRLYSL